MQPTGCKATLDIDTSVLTQGTAWSPMETDQVEQHHFSFWFWDFSSDQLKFFFFGGGGKFYIFWVYSIKSSSSLIFFFFFVQ